MSQGVGGADHRHFEAHRVVLLVNEFYLLSDDNHVDSVGVLADGLEDLAEIGNTKWCPQLLDNLSALRFKVLLERSDSLIAKTVVRANSDDLPVFQFLYA